MHQENLWASAPTSTGLTVRLEVFGRAADRYRFSAAPQWHGNITRNGHEEVILQPADLALVPSLLTAAFEGWNTTDPGRWVPKRVRNVLYSCGDDRFY